jgi:hypothetical protein
MSLQRGMGMLTSKPIFIPRNAEIASIVARPPCHLPIALLQHSTLSCSIITHLAGLRPSHSGDFIPPLPSRDVRHHPLLAT